MKIVTSAYELLRTCGKGHYKAFEASYMRAIKALPKCDWIEYVIYTDQGTYNSFKDDFAGLEAQQNVTIKFFEWRDSEYTSKIQPIVQGARDANDCESIFDKHIIVDGYCEVVLNKFNFVHENITDEDDDVFWVDGGLFLGSCNFPWRDWIAANCNTEYFFNKLQAFGKNNFMIVQSEYMPHCIEARDTLNSIIPEATGQNLVVAGGIWGGDAQKVKIITKEMAEYGHIALDAGLTTSDQECMVLSLMKDNSRFKIARFGDWYDYQRVFLQILDVYNPETYNKDVCNLSNIEA